MNIQLLAPPSDGSASRLHGLNTTRGNILGEAFAHVIATYCDPQASAFVPALGLGQEQFIRLLQANFP